MMADRENPTSIFHKKDRLFVDVGANIGLYSMRYSNLFDKVLAIEPNPVTHGLLVANIALKGLETIVPVECALSEREGHMDLSIDLDGSLGWAKIVDRSTDKGDDSGRIRVTVERMDSLLSRLAPDIPLSVVKIDVEGHELEVLRGAEASLKRFSPVVLYEQNNVAGSDDCAAFLRELGYNRFSIFQRVRPRTLFFGKTTLAETIVEPEKLIRAALVCAAKV